MPLNKANFKGRSSKPTREDVMWEVTFTVTDPTPEAGTSGSQAAPVTKQASFAITNNETSEEIASALVGSWNQRNPEHPASSDSSDATVVLFPGNTSQQRFKVGDGEWKTLGASISGVVEGVEVNDT